MQSRLFSQTIGNPESPGHRPTRKGGPGLRRGYTILCALSRNAVRSGFG
jgi:hypothetical protein